MHNAWLIKKMDLNKIQSIANQATVLCRDQSLNGTVPSANPLYDRIFAELLLADIISNVEVWEKDSRNHISYLLRNHYEN
jgi:hypothetical protein